MFKVKTEYWKIYYSSVNSIDKSDETKLYKACWYVTYKIPINIIKIKFHDDDDDDDYYNNNNNNNYYYFYYYYYYYY